MKTESRLRSDADAQFRFPIIRPLLRSLVALGVFASLAAPAPAQEDGAGGCVLTTLFMGNGWTSVGGAVYFSLEALAGSGGVTISDIDLNCNSSTAGNAVSIDVYVQPNDGSCSYDPSGVWVLKTTGTGVYAGSGNPTNFALSSPLEPKPRLIDCEPATPSKLISMPASPAPERRHGRRAGGRRGREPRGRPSANAGQH